MHVQQTHRVRMAGARLRGHPLAQIGWRAADPTGYTVVMSDETPETPEITVDDERVAKRAGLVGAEAQAGSDDPEAQARAILEDSEMRTADRDAAPGSFVEHRRSEDTVPPAP